MNSDPPTAQIELWNAYVEAYSKFAEAGRALFAPGVDRVGLVRAALQGGRDKVVVAQVIPHLSPDELKPLFPMLITWCSVGHGLVHIFREAVGTLPRTWVLEQIEGVAEPLLGEGTDETYRRLLELYWELDSGLTERLARRAAEHQDEDVKEAGNDFLNQLSRSTLPGSPSSNEPVPESLGTGRSGRRRRVVG